MRSKKRNSRPRRTPARTCIACREVADKRSLVRLVRADNEIHIDLTGKQAGRGAYLHRRRSCWTNAINNKQIIAHALKTTVTDEDLERLSAFANAMQEAKA